MLKTAKESVFLAEMGELPKIIDLVIQRAEEVELHPKRIMHLQLGVEEAVVNIINYAYEVPPGEILVRTWSEGDKFMVEFRDQGVPFDPLSVEEPDLKAELEDRQVGGLGIFLTRRVMDEVYYRRENDQNILGMVVRNVP